MSVEPSNFELFQPLEAAETGVLVLAGSSGAFDRERAQLLADHGVVALAFRWFGGLGQQSGPWEVPLETFSAALDVLATDVDRLAILGLSYGAEAALLTAARDGRVSAVVAIAPSAFVWPSVVEAGRLRSHWTSDDSPLEYVPLVESWEPSTDPPSFRSWYETSVAASESAHFAEIPVEQIDGEVVLIAGADDQVWPSDTWARHIERRRTAHGRRTEVVVHPNAGHRVIFPGEKPVNRGQVMRRGGSDVADAELGARAWPSVAHALRLNE